MCGGLSRDQFGRDTCISSCEGNQRDLRSGWLRARRIMPEESKCSVCQRGAAGNGPEEGRGHREKKFEREAKETTRGERG